EMRASPMRPPPTTAILVMGPTLPHARAAPSRSAGPAPVPARPLGMRWRNGPDPQRRPPHGGHSGSASAADGWRTSSARTFRGGGSGVVLRERALGDGSQEQRPTGHPRAYDHGERDAHTVVGPAQDPGHGGQAHDHDDRQRHG